MNALVTNTILQGDAFTQLKTLPSNSIDCVVTSPPYWMLRDYGIDEQLGVEAHFDDFIYRLSGIFDEVKRVLKPTGTCFVNLGDTYSSQKLGEPDRLHSHKISMTQRQFRKRQVIPRKSLCLVPFRFSIDMVNRGWLLRNTLIWHKPNAMPQSVKDRFTVDFEYVFFFTRSTQYYFAQQFEPMNVKEARYRYKLRKNKRYNVKTPYQTQTLNPDPERPGRNKRGVWSIPTKPYVGAHIAPYPEALVKTPILAGCPDNGIVLDPFLGSGTTAKVAKALGRQYIGIEINPEYVELAKARIATAHSL